MPFLGNSQESSLGDFMGQLQAIIDSTTGNQYQNLSNFQQQPGLLGTSQQIGLPSMQSYLQGQYQRDLGQAGRAGGAAAAAYGGTNPYAFIQHAQAPVGNAYASQFAQLPLDVFRTTMAGQNQNFQHLLSLLLPKLQAAGGRSSGFGGALQGAGPGILQGALSFPRG